MNTRHVKLTISLLCLGAQSLTSCAIRINPLEKVASTGSTASDSTPAPAPAPPQPIVSKSSIISPAGNSMVALDVDWSRSVAYASTREAGKCFYAIDFSNEAAPSLIASIGTGTTPSTLGQTCLGIRLYPSGKKLLVSSYAANLVEYWDLGSNPLALSWSRLTSTALNKARRLELFEAGATTAVNVAQNLGAQQLSLDEGTLAFSVVATSVVAGVSPDFVNEGTIVSDGVTRWLISATSKTGEPIHVYDAANGAEVTNFPITNGSTLPWYWTTSASANRLKAFAGGTGMAFFEVSGGSVQIRARQQLPSGIYRDSAFAQINGRDYVFAVINSGWLDQFDVTDISNPVLVSHTEVPISNVELYGVRVNPATRRAIAVSNRGELFVINIDGLTPATSQYTSY